MNTNLTEILKSIPDFEDFMNLIDEIGELAFKKMQLENNIKAQETYTFRQVMSQPEFQVNGKPPSVAYAEKAYLFTGFDDAITEDRVELVDITSKLEKKKLQLGVYKDMIDVFRTLSASSRTAQF